MGYPEKHELIGYLVLKEPKVYTNTYECAAWYQKVEVPAGKYPVYGYQLSSWPDAPPPSDQIDHYSCRLKGKVVGSNFSSYFCGNMVGSGKFNEDVGQDAEYLIDGGSRGYALAWSILKGESDIELLPEFEAREVPFEYEGEMKSTAGIFKKEAA